MIEIKTTERGFGIGEFKDSYGAQCSLQISSACGNENNPNGYIWLGLSRIEPTIMNSDASRLGLPSTGSKGWTEFHIPKEVLLTSRMHLNEHQVKDLIHQLNLWLETGEFSS